jgi:hypothetical protein
MSVVDRLALVSKVLLNSRFLELKRENEDLKLRLLWVDYSINTLKKFMCWANNRSSGPRCRCSRCMCVKRSRPSILDGYDDEAEDEECKFGPWFEKIVQEHGLSFALSGSDDACACCAIDREFYPKPDVNAHFLLRDSKHVPVTTWVNWVYGAKVWKAQTTQDPELLKLKALFETVRYDPDWSVLDTHDSDTDS